ncbi:MAG: hypothetical protein FWD17_04695 [Polyangiaceae bacterium]|nr:hypothetical protein [Polyangiaceae bacterium]
MLRAHGLFGTPVVVRAVRAGAILLSCVACNRGPREATATQGSHPAPESNAPAPGPTAATVLPPAPALDVPWTAGALRPTGHFDVDRWAPAANTHTLLDESGRGAVPVNEVRFLWGQSHLYAFFYAGDLDLQARATQHDGPVWKDDSVVFAFYPSAPRPAEALKWVVQVTPTGVLADGTCPLAANDLGDPRCSLAWESGARVGTDYDGTLNKIGDNDEEWAVELSIPLKSIGTSPDAPGATIAATVRRCEMAHDGARACGLWGSADRPGALRLVPGRD